MRRAAYRLLTCPVASEHGPLLDWPTERWGFFCPHSGHGGNGRFFTTVEAEGTAAPKTGVEAAHPAVPPASTPASGAVGEGL